MRRWPVALSIALIASMSGCGQSSVPESPLPSAGASAHNANVPASATPADASAAASAMLVRTTALELVDADGEGLAALSFYDPVEDVVAELTLAIGRELVIERYEGHDEMAPGTAFNWDGLVVDEPDRTIGEAPLYTEWGVKVTAATVGPLAISTVATVTVGLSQAQVEERVPGTLSALLGSEADGEMMAGTYDEIEVGRDDDGTVLTHSIHVRLSDSPLAVTQIWGPVRNWGDH